MFEVTVEQTFAAGHALRNYHGKSEDVHGHNYRVRVTVEGQQLDSTGLLVDFLEVNRQVFLRQSQRRTAKRSPGAYLRNPGMGDGHQLGDLPPVGTRFLNPDR